MVLIDYILRDLAQAAAKKSTYDEQFIVAKLDAIERNAMKT